MQARSPDLAIKADHEACAALIRSGSRSFFAASRLLPSRVRSPALALYAFCRLADDAIDAGTGESRLDALRTRLSRIYAGRPEDFPADRALADVVARHTVPRPWLEALLEGFQWDLERRRYAELDDLCAYGVRVAGSVGVVMACIMDTSTPAALACACDLGVAMQLTNIARDVGEDARMGRLYLPVNWLREAGIDPDGWLAEPQFRPEIAATVNRLLQAADALYARATEGIVMLPRDCQPAIQASRALYAEIGHELRRTGSDSVSRRTVVPARRKALVLGRVVVESLRPSIPAIRVQERVQWLFELFERLERRDRGATDEPAAAARFGTGLDPEIIV